MTIPKPGVPTARRASLHTPGLRFEKAAWKDGHAVVAGVDEVGRGAWAGPLVAAALVLPQDPVIRGRLTRTLNRHGLTPRDSKQLTHQHRLEIRNVLDSVGITYAIVEVPVAEIDLHGVGQANQQALAGAIRSLAGVDYALIDAFPVNGLDCRCHPVIGGDRQCLSIALASIVAKVHRDNILIELDAQLPGYGFATHKGYGTVAHRRAILELGVSEHHRRSFRPVAEALERA